MRRRLERPHQLPRIRIQRNQRAGVEIIARPRAAVQNRSRVPGSPVNQIQLGIICPGNPRHSSRGLLRSPSRWRAIPLPLRLPRLRIDRPDIAGEIIQISGNAHQHVVPDSERRHGGPVTLLDIGNDHVPAHGSIVRIQGHQVCIRRQKVEISLVHRDATMPDMKPFVLRVVVMPDLVAGARIDCPDIVGNREVQNPVDQQRRRLDLRRLLGLESPG